MFIIKKLPDLHVINLFSKVTSHFLKDNFYDHKCLFLKSAWGESPSMLSSTSSETSSVTTETSSVSFSTSFSSSPRGSTTITTSGIAKVGWAEAAVRFKRGCFGAEPLYLLCATCDCWIRGIEIGSISLGIEVAVGKSRPHCKPAWKKKNGINKIVLWQSKRMALI